MSENDLDKFISENKQLLNWMCLEISVQVKKSLVGGNRLNELLKNTNSNTSDEIWPYLDMLIYSASCLGHIFSPSGRSLKINRKLRDFTNSRGEALRFLFDLNLNHDIFLARKLRNKLAHIDEYLDDWWNEPKTPLSIHVNRAIMNAGPERVVSGGDSSVVLKHFNTNTLEFSFRGKTFSTMKMFNAVKKIEIQLPVVLKNLNGF